ncbi:hypothetical protein Bca52824_071058 [Brassica carinata]|uniref:Ubiquitin-like protease family profile domain-containing protein n=1 Tax=Brassica carinata TaxID=52824 RepID=A0A8X7QAH0_BRACI|nr:hypothetical protein Bca52824_071058 [Brassica carinata]
MEGPKKRRPFGGDGNDEAEIFWSDSKKHKKNNGDGFSDDETMRMHDNHCDGRTPNARFWEKALFLEVGKHSEVDVSTPIGPKLYQSQKTDSPEPLETLNKDWRSVHPAQEIEEAFPKLQETQIYSSRLEKAQLQEFHQFSMKPHINFLDCQMFNIDFWFVLKFRGIQIVIGIHVSNKFFPSDAANKLFHRKRRGRNDKKVLLVDVDRCTPMMWGKDHWVGLVINLTCDKWRFWTATFSLMSPIMSSHPKKTKHFHGCARTIFTSTKGLATVDHRGQISKCMRGYSYEDIGQIDDKRKCNVQSMVTFATCQICTGGQFESFSSRVNTGNTNAIYYEGLYAKTDPVGIFNVCIGNVKEAKNCFSSKLITMTFADAIVGPS